MGSVFLFGDCRLDPARRELTRAGVIRPVEPQVLDIILDLVENRERVVKRDELMDRIWAGRVVTLSTLNSRIKSARQALGDNGREQALLRTFRGRGFRFVGAVRIADATEPAESPPGPLSPEAVAPGSVSEAARTSAGHLDAAAAANAVPPEPAEVPLEEERRQLTIVRCSLHDQALSLATLDPEKLAGFLERANAVLVETFSALGGYVAQTYAAGVLVYFGWPRASEHAAHLAVEAALTVGPALARLSAASGVPVEVRTGIATGTVLVIGGARSGDSRLAAGHAPILAERLLNSAGPGDVVLAESTRTLIGETFVLEKVDDTEADDPALRSWRVAGRAAVATRFAARLDTRLAAPVGRDEELALLRRRWERACTGEGQVLVVSGDAGIGKSRLVHACAQRVSPDESWRIRIQCLPHHENSPLHPVIRALKRWAGVRPEDTAAASDAGIRRLSAAAGGWSVETAELVRALLAPRPDGSPHPTRLPEQMREKTLETLTGMLQGLSRQRPTLVLVEDAHWIDPTTAELLYRIVDLAAGAAMLVLVTHRREFAPEWVRWPHVGQLALSRLTVADAKLMAQRTAGDVRLSDTVQTEIAARTDGVPLYIEELTHAILALRVANSGLPANDDDVVHIPSDIPATLHDLLRSQLDRLGEGGEVARIGAVIGRTFDRELLGRIVGLPESELDGSLDRLAASGLVFATDASNQRYVFKHALVQDAAYQGLTTRRRQRLHAQIAAALESAAISGHPPDPEVLAHHFEAAGELEKAFVQWRQAGANAAARYAHAEAVAQFRRAQALLGPAPEDDARRRREAELLRQLGPSMIASLGDGHPAVQATYARFETLCNAVGDDGLHCDALFGLSQCAQVCEPVDRSLVISKRYVEVARRVDDGQQLAIAHWILAQDYWRAGRFAEGRAEARRGRKAFDTTKPTGNLLEHPEILNRTVEDYCASMLGDTGAAIADLRRMADEAATAANPLSPKRTLTVLGVTLQFLGLLDETATVVRKMTELSTARGWRDDGDWSALLRAWVLTGTGDTAAAIDQAQRSVDAIARKSRRSRRLSILADTLAKSGRIESAQALIARALQEGEALGERFWEAELMRQRGELALTQGDTDRAAADFELSLAVARSQGSLLFALKTAVSLGGLRHRQRRGGEAAALVAPILQRFTDTFDFPARREARRLCSVKRTR